MLVEDNLADARLVREALAEHTVFAFQVVHFVRIEQALAFLARDAVDLALLDYHLPDVDGLDGLTRIITAAPNLPVVMLTGLDDDAAGLRMINHGAQDYMVKGSAGGAMLVRAIRQAIERKRLSDQVRDNEERFTLAAAGSGDGIWDWKIPGDRLLLSPRARNVLGLADDTPDQGMEAFTRRIHLDDIGRFRDAMAAHLKGQTPTFRQQTRMMDSQAQPHWVLVRGLSIKDAAGVPLRMAGSITDLANLDAYYDSATNLPNRALLIDRLRGVLKRNAENAEHHAALLLICFTGYPQVTEMLGHTAGDILIAEAARKIEISAQPGDFVARVSSREVALLIEVTDVDAALAIAARVCRALKPPIAIEGHSVVPTMQMGVVLATAAYSDPESVMRDAAAALTESSGTDLAFSMFNPEIRDRASKRMRIESSLRLAIERNALELVYQPIVALNGGALRGFEALLRWHDSEFGHLSPALIVPMADDIGLIEELGPWILRTACQQIVKWRAAGLIVDRIKFDVGINLHGRQLDDVKAVDRILAILAETGAPASNLTLEINETALAANPDGARDALMAIKLHGVGLAMDNFGTGYSSLSYLGRFPIDRVKIDRSFVSTIAAGAASPLLKGIIGLTKALGLHSVAGGVENAEQQHVLAALGCHDAQGWWIGRPLDVNGAEALLQSAARTWPIAGAERIVEQEGIGVERRLAAIVAADIVGYSRMMAEDEVGTVHALNEVRGVVDLVICAYRGRIVNTAGDSYMLEFASVVDAVTCAIAMQHAMATRNAEQPEGRRMEFRIGVNLGDIIVRGSDILGDGVNVAARLEALAMPGSICVSAKVYEEVAHKLDLHFEDIGAQQVKNIARPIHAYRTLLPSTLAGGMSPNAVRQVGLPRQLATEMR